MSGKEADATQASDKNKTVNDDLRSNLSDDSETEFDKNSKDNIKSRNDDKDRKFLRNSLKDRRDRISPKEQIHSLLPKSSSFKINKNDKNFTFNENRKISLEKEISTLKYADGSELQLYSRDDVSGKYKSQRVITKPDTESQEYLASPYKSFTRRRLSVSNRENSRSYNIASNFHERYGTDVINPLTKYSGSRLQDYVSAPSLNLKDESMQGLDRGEQGKRNKITRFYSQSYQNKGELKVDESFVSQHSTKSSLAAIWGAKQESLKKRQRKSNLSRKLSSWEERTNVERRRSLAGRGTSGGRSVTPRPLTSGEGIRIQPDTPSPLLSLPLTLPPYLDTKDLRYCFQHPYLRILTTSCVILCNFLMFAEDPISHSHAECLTPVAGNVLSFLFTKYPPDWRWSLVKVLMWMLAILCGLVFGKILIHDLLFGKYMRLKMFRDEQGSWILMFLTVMISLYLFSHLYNLILFMFYNKQAFRIDSSMGISNSTVMKAAVCGTWLGDLVTFLMVLDVMLQDSLYPSWSPSIRSFWRRSNVCRVVVFWMGSALATGLVVTLVVTESLSWDTLNRDVFSSTELSRAFLASMILVLDLVIMMQDWDFPHFTTTLHINLPGFSVSRLQCKYAQINLTGKWFSYGVIFMVMFLDLNMWQNQIFYYPAKFGQYTGPDNKIRTVLDLDQIRSGNSTLDWQSRSEINPDTRLPYYLEDLVMNSRYMGYPLILKCCAFLPSIITLSIYIWLIYLYGRFPQIKEKVTISNTNDETLSGTESQDEAVSV